ncbi:hypothetical protein ACP4OV_019494 [Aristida adscensionis]
MAQPKILPLLLTATLCCLSALPSRTAASGGGGGKPLVTAITKDAATSLYTAPLRDGRPLVLDLSGPLVWTTCEPEHETLECHHRECVHAHAYHPPRCPHTGNGVADEADRFRCKCTAHPYNPSTGAAATGDLTRVALAANATDGRNPLRPVSFPAVASCAPDAHLAKLPAAAAGVAGLARARLALPAQVARAQGVADKFALCLPSGGGGQGVAIFGGGPLFLLPPGGQDVTARLAGGAALRRSPESPGYYVSAKSVAVNQQQVPLSVHGPLAVELSSTTPYTVLRPDVYAPFVKAFDDATAERKRVTPPAPAPFELCYDSRELGSTRLGYAVPQVDLVLEGGSNWTVFGGNSMVQVSDDTACFAFLRMEEGKKGGYGEGAAAPAVVIGGFQMENNLLVFDEEKRQLGFSGLLFGRQTTCSNFNFTLAA